jgi:hypothetical protein
MYNVLLILLHRPFVSEGHLHTNEPSIAVKSFAVCSKAAKAIVPLVRVYDQTFSTRRAPYLISYAVYVAATIHVRIAAQREPDSNAHIALRTCLEVFEKNQETNWAVRRAKLVILNLMKRVGVSLASRPEDKDSAPPTKQNLSFHTGTLPPREDGTGAPLDNPTTPELDIDMIIQSFIKDQGSAVFQNFPSSNSVPAFEVSHTASLPSDSSAPVAWGSNDLANSYLIEDSLFGFYGSTRDNFWMDDFGNANHGS